MAPRQEKSAGPTQWEDFSDTREESAAHHALDLVFGDREKMYGHPLDDFTVTAEFWTTWLKAKGYLRDGAALMAEDVGPMMTLLKLSRETRRHLWDNIVDGIGYLITLGRVIKERRRRDRES